MKHQKKLKEVRMNTMIKKLKEFYSDEEGVTAIEYGLIAAGIGIAIVTIVGTVGTSLVAVFTTVNTELQ